MVAMLGLMRMVEMLDSRRALIACEPGRQSIELLTYPRSRNRNLETCITTPSGLDSGCPLASFLEEGNGLRKVMEVVRQGLIRKSLPTARPLTVSTDTSVSPGLSKE